MCVPVKAKSESIKAGLVCLIKVACSNVAVSWMSVAFYTLTKVTKATLCFRSGFIDLCCI